MKIGILTFHRAQNYGAVLQCYALSRYLEQIGNTVEVIDYCPDAFREEYLSFPRKMFRQASFLGKLHILFNTIVNYPLFYRRNRVFKTFLEKYIPLSTLKYNECNCLIDGYDIIVWGSDQVWNQRITGGYDRVYAGDINKARTLFVSYAASTMMDKIDEENEVLNHYFKKILERFDCVSTRETQFADYLNSFKIRDVKCVLDPVFLLNQIQWEKISKKPKEENYLLVYSVPQNSHVSEIGKSIADTMGLKTIEIAPKGLFSFKKGEKRAISPQEFLGYFMNASFVVTSSFHGTAFSVRFQKPFYLILKDNKYDGRAYNLLKELQMEERAVVLDQFAFPPHDIDYNNVEPRLFKLEQRSKGFINDFLNI